MCVCVCVCVFVCAIKRCSAGRRHYFNRLTQHVEGCASKQLVKDMKAPFTWTLTHHPRLWREEDERAENEYIYTQSHVMIICGSAMA